MSEELKLKIQTFRQQVADAVAETAWAWLAHDAEMVCDLALGAIELERANASLLAQAKAWEDKAGEVEEPYRFVWNGEHMSAEGCWYDQGRTSFKWMREQDYDALSAALVVARKENEGVTAALAKADQNQLGNGTIAVQVGRLVDSYTVAAHNFSVTNKALVAYDKRASAAEAESAGMREALKESESQRAKLEAQASTTYHGAWKAVDAGSRGPQGTHYRLSNPSSGEKLGCYECGFLTDQQAIAIVAALNRIAALLAPRQKCPTCDSISPLLLQGEAQTCSDQWHNRRVI